MLAREHYQFNSYPTWGLLKLQRIGDQRVAADSNTKFYLMSWKLWLQVLQYREKGTKTKCKRVNVSVLGEPTDSQNGA